MRASKITVSLILLVISIPSIADILVSDEKSFYQKYYENINRTIESAKKLVVKNSKLIGLGIAAENQVEATNNGFANVVARLDKAKEERQTLSSLNDHSQQRILATL